MRRRDPVVIQPYLGYGTLRRLSVCGRVLQDEGFLPAAASDRRLRNLAAFLKRMESDEVPRAGLCLSFRKLLQKSRSDREGYFSATLDGAKAKPGWNALEVRLESNSAVRAKAEVLVPSPEAEFGVISDIDDTVVRSNVIRKARMLLTVAFANSRTRKPFEGAAAFYRALHRRRNPFFYVSKSPWNLYVPLVEFLDLQGFPKGPLLLRNFGLGSSKTHKHDRIEEILQTYPGLPFILIGDSGEKDPEIYGEVVRRHPKRIRVIYIRSVDPAPERIAAVGRLAARVAKTGCQLVLVPDSALAAAHAAGEGLIQPSDLRRVCEDASEDASILSKATLSTAVLK